MHLILFYTVESAFPTSVYPRAMVLKFFSGWARWAEPGPSAGWIWLVAQMVQWDSIGLHGGGWGAAGHGKQAWKFGRGSMVVLMPTASLPPKFLTCGEQMPWLHVPHFVHGVEVEHPYVTVTVYQMALRDC